MDVRQLKKLNILMINTVDLEDNGISTFILNSCYVLSNTKNNVSIIAPNQVKEELKAELQKNSIDLIELSSRKNSTGKYFLDLLKVMSRGNFDLVHINGNSNTMAIELVAATLAGIKIRITHSHNTVTEHTILHKLLSPLFKSTYTLGLACNQAAGEWLYGKRKFSIINNGIALEKYRFDPNVREMVRAKYGIAKNEIILGNVGKFNFQKNQIFLIELLKKMDKKYKLLIVGDGEKREELLEKSREVKNRVIFTGSVNNVNEHLMAMDLFLLPSKFEGQPFSLIEAMATGIPCLVSDKVSRETDILGRNKYLTIDNNDEWIHELKNIGKIDAVERTKISEDSISRLKEKNYDTTKNILDMLDIYQNAMERNDKKK